jgi:hypothetical protein
MLRIVYRTGVREGTGDFGIVTECGAASKTGKMAALYLKIL